MPGPVYLNPHYKNNPVVTVTDNGVSLDVRIERVSAGCLSVLLQALKDSDQSMDQTEFCKSLRTKLWEAMEKNAQETGLLTQRPMDFSK